MRSYQPDGLPPLSEQDNWSVGGGNSLRYPNSGHQQPSWENGNRREIPSYYPDQNNQLNYQRSAEPSYAGQPNGAREYRNNYDQQRPPDTWSQGQGSTLSRNNPNAGDYDAYGRYTPSLTSTNNTLPRNPAGGHYAPYSSGTVTSSTLPRNLERERDERYNQTSYGTMPHSLTRNDSVCNKNFALQCVY